MLIFDTLNNYILLVILFWWCEPFLLLGPVDEVETINFQMKACLVVFKHILRLIRCGLKKKTRSIGDLAGNSKTMFFFIWGRNFNKDNGETMVKVKPMHFFSPCSFQGKMVLTYEYESKDVKWKVVAVDVLILFLCYQIVQFLRSEMSISLSS